MALQGTLHRVFAQNLRRVRIEKGLTQGDMAQRMDTTQSAYSSLENGRRAPTLTTVERAAVALGVSYEELLLAGPPKKVPAVA